MTLGFSLMLIAIGAILAFAVNYEAAGFDINAAGVIVMVVGLIGLLMWLLLWSSFSPFEAGLPRRRPGPVHEEPIIGDDHGHYHERERVVVVRDEPRQTPHRDHH